VPSFQYRELVAEGQVFKNQPATTVEESEDHTREENKLFYHVLSRFARKWEYHILLKSQADRILARERGFTESTELHNSRRSN
jgi:hypothetical protein